MYGIYCHNNNKIEYWINDILKNGPINSMNLKKVDDVMFFDYIKKNYKEDLDFFLFHPEIFEGKFYEET